jgi:2-polyprenyl-6-methoxyphenol hydroxylase-like FAD-dependent oxidoreductase
MADATYDAVIIGAGHNGLALGTYLAKSGLDVAIFEKRAMEAQVLSRSVWMVSAVSSPKTEPICTAGCS